MFEELIQQVEALSPFRQTIVASVLLMLVLALTRYMYQQLTRIGRVGGGAVMRAFYHDAMMRYWIRKSFVFSNENEKFIVGHIFVIREAQLMFMRVSFLASFVFTVWSVVNAHWLLAIGFYLLLNGTLDGIRWLGRPKGAEEIEKIPDEIKREFYKQHSPFLESATEQELPKPIAEEKPPEGS